MTPPVPITRVAWSVRDWAAAVSVSRVTVHRLVKADLIKSKLMGRKRLILTTPEEYVEGLATTVVELPAIAAGEEE
jgi:predicted site-specific integrase-resolvase